MIKYRWRVYAAPTGKYRSFQRRGWPYAETAEGDMVARLSCEDDYRNGGNFDHSPLVMYIAKASLPEDREKYGAFRWLRFKKEFATIDEAKAALAAYIESHPDH